MIVLRETRSDDPVATAQRRRYLADLVTRISGRSATEAEVDAHLVAAHGGDLVPPDGLVVLAVDDATGDAVGGAGLRLLGVEVPDDAAEVKRMFVDPAVRGRGVATTLVGRLAELAAAAGRERLVLDTRDELVEAIALYRRLGFSEIAPYNANPWATSWWERRLGPGVTPART